jgi:hypothetical protein
MLQDRDREIQRKTHQYNDDMCNQAHVLNVTKRALQDLRHELRKIKLEQAKLKGQPDAIHGLSSTDLGSLANDLEQARLR